VHSVEWQRIVRRLADPAPHASCDLRNGLGWCVSAHECQNKIHAKLAGALFPAPFDGAKGAQCLERTNVGTKPPRPRPP